MLAIILPPILNKFWDSDQCKTWWTWSIFVVNCFSRFKLIRNLFAFQSTYSYFDFASSFIPCQLFIRFRTLSMLTSYIPCVQMQTYVSIRNTSARKQVAERWKWRIWSNWSHSSISQCWKQQSLVSSALFSTFYLQLIRSATSVSIFYQLPFGKGREQSAECRECGLISGQK